MGDVNIADFAAEADGHNWVCSWDSSGNISYKCIDDGYEGLTPTSDVIAKAKEHGAKQGGEEKPKDGLDGLEVKTKEDGSYELNKNENDLTEKQKEFVEICKKRAKEGKSGVGKELCEKYGVKSFDVHVKNGKINGIDGLPNLSPEDRKKLVDSLGLEKEDKDKENMAKRPDKFQEATSIARGEERSASASEAEKIHNRLPNLERIKVAEGKLNNGNVGGEVSVSRSETVDKAKIKDLRGMGKWKPSVKRNSAENRTQSRAGGR